MKKKPGYCMTAAICSLFAAVLFGIDGAVMAAVDVWSIASHDLAIALVFLVLGCVFFVVAFILERRA